MAYNLFGPETRANPFEREAVSAMLNNGNKAYFPIFERGDFFLQSDTYSGLKSEYDGSEALAQFSDGIIIPYDLVRPKRVTNAFLKKSKTVKGQHIPDMVFLQDKGDFYEAIPIDFKGKEYSGITSGASANHYEPTQISPYNMKVKLDNSKYLERAFNRVEQDTGKRIVFGGGCFISRRDVVSDTESLNDYLANVSSITGAKDFFAEPGLIYDGHNLRLSGVPGFSTLDNVHFIGNNVSETVVRNHLKHIKNKIGKTGMYPFGVMAVTDFDLSTNPELRLLYDPQGEIVTSNPALEELEVIINQIDILKSLSTAQLSEIDFFKLLDPDKMDDKFAKRIAEDKETPLKLNISGEEFGNLVEQIQQMYNDEVNKAWRRIDTSYKVCSERCDEYFREYGRVKDDLAELRNKMDPIQEDIEDLEDILSERKTKFANAFEEAKRHLAFQHRVTELSRDGDYMGIAKAVLGEKGMPDSVYNSFAQQYAKLDSCFSSEKPKLKKLKKQYAPLRKKVKALEKRERQLHEELFGIEDKIEKGAYVEVRESFKGDLADVKRRRYNARRRDRDSRSRKQKTLDNDWLDRSIRSSFEYLELREEQEGIMERYESFLEKPVAWFRENMPERLVNVEGLLQKKQRKESHLVSFERECEIKNREMMKSRKKGSRDWFNYYETLRDVALDFLEEQEKVLHNNLEKRNMEDAHLYSKIVEFADKGIGNGFSTKPTFPFPMEFFLSLNGSLSYHMKTFSSINISKN